MFGWVDVGKRKFFALLMLLIAVEVILVVLIARAEHHRFPPVPGSNDLVNSEPLTPHVDAT